MGPSVFYRAAAHHLTMKAFIFLVAAASSASAALTCEECQQGTVDLVTRLTSDESIAEQIAIMEATVCPSLPPELNCAENLEMWWGDAATCIYQHIAEADPCVDLGYCSKRRLLSQVRDWTCEECNAILERVSGFLQDDATIADSISYLQGECFCGQEGHTDSCPSLVETLLPLAMPVLGAALMEQATELCQEIAGVC